MIKMLFGVIAGVAGAVLVISLVQLFSNYLYPIPPGFDKTDPIVLAAFVSQLPITALLLVLASYVLGSLFGGFVATKVSKQYPLPAVVVSGFLTVGAVLTLVTIPHPAWFSVLTAICFLPMALVGARLAGGQIEK